MTVKHYAPKLVECSCEVISRQFLPLNAHIRKELQWKSSKLSILFLNSEKGYYNKHEASTRKKVIKIKIGIII